MPAGSAKKQARILESALYLSSTMLGFCSEAQELVEEYRNNSAQRQGRINQWPQEIRHARKQGR